MRAASTKSSWIVSAQRLCCFSIVFLRFNARCTLQTEDYKFSFQFFPGQRVLERNHHLKAENLTLSVENEKLRSGLGFGDIASTARIQALEKKLLDKQEELTDMHKRKGDNQQMIIDLNVKVTDLQKQLETRNNRWVLSEAGVTTVLIAFCSTKQLNGTNEDQRVTPGWSPDADHLD